MNMFERMASDESRGQSSADIVTLVESLTSEDIVDVLRKRLSLEHLARHFTLEEYTFSGRELAISPSDGLLFVFDTLKDRFPESYVSHHYRLLVIFALSREEEFGDDLTYELRTAMQRDNLDKIVIWTTRKLAVSRVHRLKSLQVDCVRIRREDIERAKSIALFIPPRRHDYDHAVAVNMFCDLFLKRLKKMFHLVLSEIAAPIYDKLYGAGHAATAATMAFEKSVVDGVVDSLRRDDGCRIAVDIGCGTGRHTFELAGSFDTVYGFDFSPEMIKQAMAKKKATETRNVELDVADLEYEEIPTEQQFYGRANLVVASFGMGSFIEDTAQMLRRLYSWLAPSGYLIMSFYNYQSILQNVQPNWRDTSLAAHLDNETNTLRVSLDRKTFHIFCKPFSEATRNAITNVFPQISGSYTFPTLMALMPNSLLQNATARELFEHVDKYLAPSDAFSLGHYVTVVAQKESSQSLAVSMEGAHGRSAVIAVLDHYRADYEFIEHPPVMSSADVVKFIGFHQGRMLKVVIFEDKAARLLFGVVLPAEKRVGKELIAKWASTTRGRIEFASERGVMRLGFPLGGIPAFGFDPASGIQLFIDAAVDRLEDGVVYAGTGDNKFTLKISVRDFQRITASYRKVEID
jgi:ubiquinone/menaquinone biosynthesis C-methylase UbiE/prolyl-tRNA editing enzyme YbaK/EbsC (Cys-tRNA(Pro) deacylase)